MFCVCGGESPGCCPRRKQQEPFRSEYEIPTDAQWKQWSLAEKQKHLSVLLEWADSHEVPNNSQVRETLASLVCDLAQQKVENAEQEWQQARDKCQQGEAHETIQKAVERFVKITEPIGEPPKPAPGYHDSAEHPELDAQSVPLHLEIDLSCSDIRRSLCLVMSWNPELARTIARSSWDHMVDGSQMLGWITIASKSIPK